MKLLGIFLSLILALFSFDVRAEEIENYLVQAKKLDESRNKISTSIGASTYSFSNKDINNLPQGSFSSFNQVLLQAPGVTQDSYGQLHVRNDHGNLQYRINGIIIPEGMSGFGQTLDTHFIDKVDFLTGALPAQYGYRTAGVVNIQTKQGGFKNGAYSEYTAGSYGTNIFNQQLSGSKDRFSYYASGTYLQNDVGIEAPTASKNPIHDQTEQNKEFTYLTYLLDSQTKVSAIASNSVNNFQLPNNPGQTPNYTLNGAGNIASSSLNQKQSEANRFAILALQGTSNSNIDYQVSLFSRYSNIKYRPDYEGNLVFNGSASNINQNNISNGIQTDLSYPLSDNHTLRSGLFTSRDSTQSYRDVAVFHADVNGNQTSSNPFSIIDNNKQNTTLFGYYLQDEWKATQKLTINYGGRYDVSHSFVNASQFSPRLGTVYNASNSTTLHAGYSRYFTTPPAELIAPSTLSQFQNTTNASENILNNPIKPEKTNYYDAGITHKLTSNINIGLDTYYKDIRNMLDEGQFGNSLIYTPFNYDKAKAYGLEFTSDYRKDNFSAYANFAVQKALAKNIISNQYLIGNNELNYIANNWVNPDHAQRYTASAGASYLFYGTNYSLNGIYGSGLRKGFANTQKLASYTQINFGAARDIDLPIIKKTNIRFSIVNLFDRVYQLHDGSGIGVGAPQYGARRGYYLTVSKSF